jgi:hypothetical protein
MWTKCGDVEMWRLHMGGRARESRESIILYVYHLVRGMLGQSAAMTFLREVLLHMWRLHISSTRQGRSQRRRGAAAC